MYKRLRTFRQGLEVIQRHLPGADAKFTMRAALLLVFLLERDELLKRLGGLGNESP